MIVLGLWVAVDADLPFKTRFALSQASMERFSQNLLDGGVQDAPDCAWTGLFPVCGHILDEDEGDLIGVELQISDWPIASSRCFVWSPPRGQPHADDYEYRLRHLTGPPVGLSRLGRLVAVSGATQPTHVAR
ncbi:hypothetical protein B0I32_121203 [Nonomuraea fuscirosea]|uniref:Uncharacterized protein n=1 Tax=Nonomuraea fuscirosea TaxID=1291556 RepID=A0A2T0MMR0_9ACTN|nr:hypothetical protein [Nonomuraea fuscirosea]PRX59099.1 hypothetical protein B0I32_121203 [Nonomuraea fuscirosea]